MQSIHNSLVGGVSTYSQRHIESREVGDDIYPSIADGVLPEATSNRVSFAQLMQKTSFMPVTRHSTHSCVGFDCSEATYASTTNGVEIGAAITIGGTAGGAHLCSTLSHWVYQNYRARRAIKVSVVLVQYLSRYGYKCMLNEAPRVGN